jgi:DNA-binding NarL/FixJ family response regulator
MSTHAASGPAPLGVLICDDNESIRNALRDVIGLRPSLSVVGVAADGNEAITQATQLQPDVILLDLAMPHRTGFGALPELVQVAPRAKIIVLSSLAKASIDKAVIDLGASLYLEKGATPDEINDAIETVTAPGEATPAPVLTFDRRTRSLSAAEPRTGFSPRSEDTLGAATPDEGPGSRRPR